MVQLTVRLTATSGRAHQLVEALHTLMRRTRRQCGCSDAHIAADVDEADAFWYVENWENAQALEDEFRTDRFSQLLCPDGDQRASPVAGVPGDQPDTRIGVRHCRTRGARFE